jgi:glycosyltransferase involved in cell wall biosynthesis
MNIALDGMPLSSQLTGVGHYTFELARSLALAAPADRFTLLAPEPAQPQAPASLDSMKRRSPANLFFSNLSHSLVNRRWWSIGLPLYLRHRNFDLFHGTNYEIPLWSRRPSVVTIHDLSLFLHPEAHEPHLVRRAKWRLPLMVRAASIVITPTEAVKAEVCKRFGIDGERVVVTAEAPRAVFKRREPAETFETRERLGVGDDFILFVGTLEPRKNLQRLVEAFEMVLRTTSLTPQLVIAGGRGWLMDDFAGSLQRRGLDQKVCFTGYLNDDDLSALYSTCKLFVYPSIYEGFGLPPLEAMACGAAVITSNVASIREGAGQAARLVDPLSVDDIAKAIIELLKDEQARERLAKTGSEHVKQFTWERTAQKTLEVYRKLLEPQITQSESV